MADYVAELRRLSVHCEFGPFLNDALRDRFVCGLRSELVQRRLLAEDKLTLAWVLEIAQGMEEADKYSKALKATEVAEVHKMDNIPPKRSPCYRCGRSNHDQSQCYFKDADCRECGKKGHISRACYLKSRSPSGKMPQRPATHHHMKWMAAEDPPSDIKENRLLSIGSQSSHPITVDMVINSTTLSMEVDTGAAVSVISEDTSKALFPDMALQPTQIVLKTYTGEQMQVRGQMTVEVQYQDQLSKSLTLLVVAGNSPSLLGRNWLAHFHLDWKTIASVSTTQEGTPMNPDTLLKCYKDLFSEKLGTIHPFHAELQLRPEARAKFCKARPAPVGHTCSH